MSKELNMKADMFAGHLMHKIEIFNLGRQRNKKVAIYAGCNQIEYLLILALRVYTPASFNERTEQLEFQGHPVIEVNKESYLGLGVLGDER